MGKLIMDFTDPIIKVVNKLTYKNVEVNKFNVFESIYKKLEQHQKHGKIRNLKTEWNGKIATVSWETLNSETNTWN